MSDPISLLLIDDHPLIRKGIIQLLDLHQGISLAGEADGGADGIKLIEQKQPDLVLLDLNMRDMDGLTTLKKIKKRWPAIKVVVLTVSDNPQNIFDAFKQQADGYLLKNTDPEKIIDHLLEVMKGNEVMSPEVSKILTNAPPQQNSGSRLNLTNREEEVLRLIADGLSNQDIGDRLGISVWTAKVHAKHILKKMGLSSRNELIVWAIREGFTSAN
ncbi:MAG: response regulator [Gammaproteobacteria bacterium]|jgi:two-component system nitrate/nitrite response regulator NarL|nr:response regulator [Gammaproteobacteria bacterium]MBT4607334.1 response regulator [Thiotrichales bacterium]MBT3472954.1 response regulator [Gammaproteobacteria bacterium]MBT3968402.1 response regulator [Gammaproteobacteria bacterium]MBT4080347.1 response regulator [Gammaproteobacteria bacterium]